MFGCCSTRTLEKKLKQEQYERILYVRTLL